jgi:hypothetical protein
MGVGTDGGGVYVADRFNDRVQAYTSTGEFLAAAGKNVVKGGGTGFEACTVAAECEAGEPGGLGGELDRAAGLATTGGGIAYVADTFNNRIQKVNYQTGAFLLAWGKNVGDEASLPAPLTPPSTPPAPKGVLPPPVFGQSVNVELVSGTVRIKLRGSGKFKVLTGAEQIPIGSILDTTAGRIRLISAKTRNGETETAEFYAGVFKVLQPRSGKPITELDLVDGGGAAGSSVPAGGAARKKSTANGLWGSGHGNYVTKGSHGSATVRGTIWFTKDQANGTFFKVKRGVVTVNDFGRHKKLKLRPGQHYLAKAGR